MQNKKIIYALLFTLFIAGSILGGMIFVAKSQNLKVFFLDVGQGDAALISHGKNQIIIDGGPSGQKIMEKLGRYVPFWDRELEVLMITHPDSDHIEGFIDVLNNYKVDSIIETGVTSDSTVYAKLEEIIKSKNIKKIEGKKGVVIKLDKINKLEILNSADKEAASQKETNSSSLVAKLSWKKNSFLFTGDLPMEKEAELMLKNPDISADVLKIAHHGSKYSTGTEWLKKIKPQDAIISVGKNSYGHPAQETLERLQSQKINIFRTDEKGDIVYSCEALLEECQRSFSKQ